jgi:hypothetical protein
MGWPYLGETLQLYSQDPSFFFASKQKRLVAVGNYYYSCGQRVSSFVLDPPPCSQAAND